jgi:hypothetical protein
MSADKIYNLDLQTLINFLQEQSALLYTTVDIPDMRGPCHGYLFLRKRTIIGCQIQSPDGILLFKDQEAYRLLNTKTHWQFRIEPNIDLTLKSMRPQNTQTLQPADAGANNRLFSVSYVPRVVGSLEAYLLNGYTSKQRLVLRTVFAMVNGDRTIEQIKGQLNLSSEAVDDALNYLSSIGVIE